MKVPEPRKLPSGKWNLRVQVNGQRVSITGDDKKTVQAKAAALKAGMIRPGRTATLGQAIDYYINDRANVLSPSTVRGYKLIKKSHFPALMGQQISTITDNQWQAAINREAKTYSAKTMRNSWRFVASVIRDMGYAVPRVNLPQMVPNEHDFLQPDQIPVFIDAAKGKRIETAALLALHGLRRSEILGLTWDAVDLENTVLRVSGAVVMDEDDKLVHKVETKNLTSRREVPIMIPRLTELLEAAPKNKPVVSYTPNAMSRAVNAVCASCGLPAVGVHGLRHSFASLCYYLKIPEATVMELGGWSNIYTMRKIYTHLAQAERENNVKSLRSFFQNGNENGNAISGSG